MAVITNTLNTYDVKGIREDLEGVIYNISPEDTPFVSNIGRGKASQTFHEWQTDSLAAVDTTNAKVEGDDISSFTAQASTTRVGNYCQISRKDAIVSGTNQTVDSAGRKSELAYQLAKRGSELKRDIEAISLQNQAAVAGNTTTARKLAGFPVWLKSNSDLSTGATPGANATYTNVPTGIRTDGTQRTFTETMLKNVIQALWANGGKTKMLMLGAAQKVVVSGFSGIATKTYYQSTAEAAAIIGAADVYVSDFGTLSIVPNRFQRNRDALLVDPEYAAIQFLRPIQQTPLAKTGDADKRMILCEWTLKVHNEAAHGIVADLS